MSAAGADPDKGSDLDAAPASDPHVGPGLGFGVEHGVAPLRHDVPLHVATGTSHVATGTSHVATGTPLAGHQRHGEVGHEAGQDHGHGGSHGHPDGHVGAEGADADDGDAGVHQPLTVATLLEEPLFVGATAYGSDLERPVEWCLPLSEVLVEAASGPATLRRVVVMGSGDPVDADADPDAVGELVERLRAAGASALFVNPGGRTPGWLGGLAAEPPVVLLPPEATFRRVSRLVGEKSLTRDAHVISYGVSVQRELSDVLFRGAGLSAMARRVARLSGRPVYVLGSQLDVLAYESLATVPVPDPDELVRTLQAVIRSGRVDPAPQDRERAAVLVTLELEHGKVSCVVAPMVLGGATYGWVVIVELDEPPRRHDVAQHLVLASQAAMAAGSELLRLRSVEEANERARGDFVHALLHQRFSSSHELASRAAFHTFDVGGVYVVVVASGAFDPSTTDGVGQLRRAIDGAQRLQPEGRPVTMATAVGDILVVVRQVATGRQRSRDTAKEQAVAREYATALETMLDGFASAGGTDSSVRVAYGRPGTGQQAVMHSYREARMALEISARVRREGAAGYADLRVLAVLSELAQRPDATAFAHDVLEPLRRPGKHDGDLVSVVLTYLATGGNLNATSRELFMHRNTVLYKLDKAAQLLGMDLRDAESRFVVWLAHNIQMLAEVELAVDREINPAPG